MGVFPKMGKIDDAVYGTINNRPKDLVETSKLLSWMRVAVAIDGGIILETISDNQDFASTYGTSNRSGKVGTTFAGKDIFAESDRGYRPSPVIEGVTLENGHQGLSRKAKFSIKCFTLAQAEILTQYFYQPGYCVLVEIGWNVPKSIQQRADLKNGGACEISKYNNYLFTSQKRTASEGTYDGFMGRVTGGGYQNGDDETYIIDVELTTLGEIPSYLQVHKSGNMDGEGSDTLNSSLKYEIESEINANADGGKNTGLALYQQMYNRLPNEKRSQEVKNLTGGKDILGNPWTEEYNFINVDEEIREYLLGALTDSTQNIKDDDGNTKKVVIPDGLNLMSEQSYIRFELAMAILNTYIVNIEAKDSSEGCKVPTYSYMINSVDTVIGAHKWMFSIDGSKLYIPNSFHPEFGLKQAFERENEVDVSQFINPANIEEKGRTVNLCPNEGNENEYAFPCPRPYTSQKQEGVISTTAPAHSWGYLRNLYINLDFFIEVLTRSNYVAKDIYYELLNGMSAAAGSFWHFELAETPCDNPDNPNHNHFQIEIKDLNFLGTGDKSKNAIKEFYSKGVDSPFISSNLDMPIPAVMRGSVLGRNSSAKVNTKGEGADQKYDGFFRQELDDVTKILDSFKEQTETLTPQVGEPVEAGDSSEKEVARANMELFLSKATIVPREQVRRGKTDSGFWAEFKRFITTDTVDGVLNEYLGVIAWNDSKILKQLEVKWTGVMGEDNSPISPIVFVDFEFEIHGIAGLKVGDVFRVVDIPSNFKDGVFQIMSQSHSLSGGLWMTTVNAKLRNFKVE